MSAKAAIVPTQHNPNPYDEQRSVTPMELLQIAMSRDADVDKLAQLMELHLKWEANQAKKAFVSAMAAFKSDPPEIVKNKKVAFGQTAYSHATLDEVCDKVTAGLSKHGISHRWRIEQDNAMVKVTCILTHELGHSEETAICGGPDVTGSKNAIQAIGSAITYLERYSLLAATGLAAANADTDGREGPQMDKLQEYLDSMATAPNMTVLQNTFNAGFKEASKLKNSQAMMALVSAKDARKRELQKESR